MAPNNQAQDETLVSEEVNEELADGVEILEEQEKEEERVLSPEEQTLKDLHDRRIGTFKVGIAFGDAKYLRNLLDKSEFTGPQQAYLLVISKNEMTSILNELKDKDQNKRHEVDMTSATIEALGYFMNNFKGKGSDSATKLFTASMLLRQPMGLINSLDQEIEAARAAFDATQKTDESADSDK